MPLSENGKKYSEDLFQRSRSKLHKPTTDPINAVPAALRPLAEQALARRGPGPPDLGLVAQEGAARADALRKAYEWENQPLTNDVIDDIMADVVGYMKTICSAKINSFKDQLESLRKRTGAANGVSQATISELRREADRTIAGAAKEIKGELDIRMFEARSTGSTPTKGAVRPSGTYTYHPEIERVSLELFAQGNYRQAVLDAYIHLIDTVRRKSGIQRDGDDLMNHAMSPDGRIPPIRFNELKSQAGRDEQRGIWNLFKGVVGLRNYKAHMVSQFDDPNRAHEYLALASLLMRLLDLATIDAPQP